MDDRDVARSLRLTADDLEAVCSRLDVTTYLCSECGSVRYHHWTDKRMHDVLSGMAGRLRRMADWWANGGQSAPGEGGEG